MEEDFEDIEDEIDSLEDEEDEEEVINKKSNPKEKQVKEDKQESTERYVAVYQEEVIGIADNVGGVMIVDGLKDLATAKLEAFKLNQSDRILVANGA